MNRITQLIALGAGAALIWSTWWVRNNPTALRYSARLVVQLPHPLITRKRLYGVLDPRAGERVLEIGPGTGYYSVPMAQWLGPSGQLEVLDVHQEFLDHTVRAAIERGLRNVVPTRGDARQLPYPDATFDAVCMIATLGEIPDQEAALREVARVLKPDARLVVGEYLADVDWVSPRALARRGQNAGLRYQRRSGTPLGYFALLRNSPQI